MTPNIRKPDMSKNAAEQKLPQHDDEFDYYDLENYEGSPPRDEPGIIDWYSPVVMFILGVIVLLAALDLGIGTLQDPGTGLWPALNAVLLIAMAPLALFARHKFEPPTQQGLLRVLGVAAPMLIFVPLYNWAGLVGAGAVALIIITRFVGGMRWLPAIVTSVMTPVIVYVVFAILLGVNLRPF